MLIHSDSFDIYNTLSQDYDVVFGAVTISSTNPRTGTQSMKTTTSGEWVQKNITLAQTIICGIGLDLTSGSPAGFNIFTLFDAATAQVAIVCDGSGHLQAYRSSPGIGGNVLLGTSSAAMPFGTYHYIEAKVKIDPSVGTVDIHVDGISFLSLSGLNTRVTTSSQVGSVVLGTFNGGTGVTIYWDDYYICDNTGSFNNGFLGPTAVLALLPHANGTLNQWAIGGSAPAATNWQSVNENPPDDGVTLVSDGTVGDIDRYTFPTITSAYPAIAVGSISAVNVKLRAELDTPGVRAIRAAVLSSATTGTSPSDLSLTTSWAAYEGILEIDPATSVPWTEAAVDAAEFGQKVTL